MNTIQTDTILHNIALELDRTIKDTSAIGLNGKAAIVLYFFYYYKFFQEEAYADKAIHLLQETIEGIDATSSVNLREGISGIGWTLEHLNENNFIAIDIDAAFAHTFDDYIYESMHAFAIAGNFDYHSGVLGFCLYFVKRFQHTQSAALKATYEDYITQVIFFMENQRIRKTLESEQFAKHTHNKTEVLTNTVNFLLLLLSLKTFDPLVRPLIAYYSALLLKEVSQNTQQNAATALCLWKVGTEMSIASMKEKAAQLFDENQFAESSASISNYYVCYQSYAYVFQKTQQQHYQKLRDAYQDQFKKALNSYQIEGTAVGIWNHLTHVGLSIIQMENKFSTNWDECLLLTTTA
ncbi:lanthionine synthetase C-like protein [Kordia sp. SMS9]|uniref:lanthionine synthetase LanC family protein n=1 Tax=Kordia sp. SMS9 TaxID=2282170 RepID=UPI000E0DB5AB|nr:lanthionine synthetase LanC family protein [Kordia sp. SMS9]AXG71688.1 lanthionine synthetase C-like protein [Kordia sp. SMS9]